MTEKDIRMVYVTCPDAGIAEDIAGKMVDERLAACVNIIPGLRSVYRWQGKIEIDSEVLLLIKTTAQRFEEVRERVVALHPDDVPEIVAVPVTMGLDAYLDWVRDETGEG